MQRSFLEWIQQINESMNVMVAGFQPEHRIETIHDLSWYLNGKLFGNIANARYIEDPKQRQQVLQSSKMLSPDEIMHFSNNRAMEQFAPDGSDFDSPVGTMNFYTQGLPQAKLQQVLQGAKFLMDELGIKHGEFRAETYQDKLNLANQYSQEQGDFDDEQWVDDESRPDGGYYQPYRSTHADRAAKNREFYASRSGDLSHIRVYRIPVEIPEKKRENEPPELNMSNSNARHIFGEVLNFTDHEEDGGFFNIPAVELLMKIDNMTGDPKSRPTEIENGGRFIGVGISSEDINRRLQTIRTIAKWAIDNGYQHIDVV